MPREQALAVLADRILAIQCSHPVRVAIDGVDAAGKTTLADELAAVVMARGRRVIRASVDGFHRPRAERYRQGADSPRGYYEDSFDLAALREALLTPLGEGGSRRYRTATFDYRSDAPIAQPETEAEPQDVLLCDGIFLLRPELDGCWEYRVFVRVPFEVMVARAIVRDADLFGTAEATRERYERKYIPAQRHYLDTVQPERRADVVVENSDPQAAYLVFADRDVVP